MGIVSGSFLLFLDHLILRLGKRTNKENTLKIINGNFRVCGFNPDIIYFSKKKKKDGTSFVLSTLEQFKPVYRNWICDLSFDINHSFIFSAKESSQCILCGI